MADGPKRHHLDKRAPEILERAQTEGDPDGMLTSREAAELMGVSRSWMELARHRGDGPPFVRVSRNMIRYRLGDLRAWPIRI